MSDSYTYILFMEKISLTKYNDVVGDENLQYSGRLF